MIRVMIAAAHAEVREGLRTALELSGDIEIAAAVRGTRDDLAAAVRGAQLDAALVDLDMPGGEGLETIRQVRAFSPSLRIIALTAHDYPAARETAIRAGACAVMVKGLAIQEMSAVIRRICEADRHPGGC